MRSARPDIVGRDAERAACERLLDELMAGRGSALVLEGQAGVGKTRLLDALCDDAADRGLRVVRATGATRERDVPLALAGRLLPDRAPAAGTDRPTPRSAHGPQDEHDPERGPASPVPASDPADPHPASPAPDAPDAAVLARRLRALGDAGPLIVAIDDAQWADDASLRALGPLAETVVSRPVCLAVATRPSGAADPAGDALAELLDAGRRVLRLPLADLGPSDAASLVRRTLPGPVSDELVERCHRATSGNPLLLRLLLDELVESGLPDPEAIAVPDVQRFVGRELRRLPADARAVAAALAVTGRASAPGLLAAVAALPAPAVAAAVADLQACGFVVPGAAPAFAHPLVERAVLDAIPAPDRAATHRAAAEALRRRGAAVDVVAVHHRHALPAGDPVVVEELRAGAARALSAGDARTAEALLRRALDEPPPAAQRPGILHALAVAAVRASGAPALDAFRVARDQQADAAERAAVELDHASALLELGRPDDALAVLDAVERDSPELPADLRLRLQARRAVLAVDLRLAERVLPRLLDAARELRPDGPAARELLVVRGYFEAVRGHPRKAVASALAALAPAEATSELPGLTVGLGVLTLAAGERFGPAEEVVEHHLTIARVRDDRTRRAAARAARGLLDLRRGALPAAEAGLRAALADTEPANRLGRTLAVAFLVHALTLRGQTADAAATLRAHRDLVDPSSAGQGLALAGASLALATGETSAGIDGVEAVRRAGLRASPVLATDRELAHAYLRTGRTAKARQAAARLVAEAELLPDARGALGVALAVEAVTGAAPRREERLLRALELLRSSELRLEHAVAAGHLGSHLRRQGRRVDARVPLREAIALAGSCDAEPLRATLEAELAATGATVPRDRDRDALTPSERRIAELAARGRSNVEIAGELVLSRKTIEMHLTSAYRKLGIRSRARLAEVLRERTAP